MLCKYFKDEQNCLGWEGYCDMPIGPTPLWLQSSENAVNKEECTKPACICECYEAVLPIEKDTLH